MYFNQSRSDKSDSQNRKSGRSAPSNQQRGPSSSSSSIKGGGGGGPPAPSHSSLSANRSVKKSNHGQGAQSRVSLPAVNPPDSTSPTPHRNVQNGAHHGTSDASISFGASIKPADTQRITQVVPKAPTSQPVTTSALPPPATNPGDASKFAFQFGSLGPAALNGMQIPARTSSAPPNLDEQKRDQARHETLRSAPPVPIPTPKQQLPRKDPSTVEQSNAGEAHSVLKAKQDVQISTAPPVSQTQKSSVVPIHKKSMQMPFHQPPVSVQFGAPNPQIQSQGVPPTSLQVPMPMTAIKMGNSPQVQQPMFVQSLQPHPMQPQGIMHQGQGLGFTHQMGSQLPPQLGNLGIGINSQYPQQQGGKFGGSRKTVVKITDPKTREELRLDKRMDAYADDGSSSVRSHPNIPPQSQPTTFPSHHPINYYPNSYAPSNLFFQPSNPLSVTSGQIPPNSQQPRYAYSVSQGPQNKTFVTSSTANPPSSRSGPTMHGAADPSNLEHSHDVHNMISTAPSGVVQVKLKPGPSLTGEKSADMLSSNDSSLVERVASDKPSKPFVEAKPSHLQKDSENIPESALQLSKAGIESSASKSLVTASKQSAEVTIDNVVPFSSSYSHPEESSLPGSNHESKRQEGLSRSNSIKDHQRKPGKKGYIQLHQVSGQPATVTGFSSRTVEREIISNDVVTESSETKTTMSPSSVNSEDLTDSVQKSVSTATPSTSNLSNDTGEHLTGVAPEISGVVDVNSVAQQAKVDDSSLRDQFKDESQGTEGHADKGRPEVSILDDCSSGVSLVPCTSKFDNHNNRTQTEFSSNESPDLEGAEDGLDVSVACHVENNSKFSGADASAFRKLDSEEVGKFQSDDQMMSVASSSSNDNVGDNKSSASDHQVTPVPAPSPSEATSKSETPDTNCTVSLAVSSSKEKSVELARSKSTTGSLKKKRKEILQKADAAGTTSDLYMAYKGPEDKGNSVTTEATEITLTNSDLKQEPKDVPQLDSMINEKDDQNKAAPDDWEDAAEMSSPKLEPANNGEHGLLGGIQNGKDENVNSVKKYSRDFLLKFSEQCTDLPERFEITADIADALMSVGTSHFVERESYPSPGRVVDRSNSGSRVERWGSGMVDDDRWGKQPGPSGAGRDLRMDFGFGGNAGFRPGQGASFGVLRTPRATTPFHYAGGIPVGQMQSIGPQSGMPRNGPDVDRWQRAANFQQKGLIPSPHTPLQVMHKAERKYEVGKVTDEEEAKQRRLKAILNKLTPQNFEKLFEQVQAVNIDNAVTLTGVISQIFDKALMEPTFCEMYANFCDRLAGKLPEITEGNEKITFKRLLLNKCQEEFEKGEKEQEEANKANEERETNQSEEEREEKRTKARRRMLGNIRLIGELYKKKMLTERIMHECIQKLLGQYQIPDEEDVEALCKLMSTIGEMIDHQKARGSMDAYFDMMDKLSNNMQLSSRVRFMLKDAIELRMNKWQQRRKVEGPKKIEEVHRAAAQERHHQSSRLSRNVSINPSPRRAPADFGPRGSAMLSSHNAQVGGFHGIPAQVRGFGNQDVHFEERQPYEARTLSVSLPRPLGDEPITLGPQGGLARGMSFRGPPAMAGAPSANISPGSVDSRRMGASLNGYSTMSERPAYNQRDEFFARHPDRYAVPAAFDQSSAHERNVSYVNRDSKNQDNVVDRPRTSPSGRGPIPASAQNIHSEKMLPEECLHDKSMAAIKEFYSARDEKEVVLCIKELNASSFHPSMISLWVTDSFERKDVERDLLAKLLVNLARSQDDRILSPVQLIKGFECVLTTLEDAVKDAPKAVEFLGRMLARAVVENVVPLREIGRLLNEGGEEPGQLLEIGLAGDVLGSTLEEIKLEKGENVLNEIRVSSNLHLEDFRPPAPRTSGMLEKFI